MSIDEIRAAVTAIATAVTMYYVIYHVLFLAVIGRAAIAVGSTLRWRSEDLLAAIFANPLTPGVTVIIPAHNEGPGIVNCVQSVLNLKYPLVQVVVIDDGSTDDTFAKLGTFQLTPSPASPLHELPQDGATEEVWSSAERNLLVLRKTSTGRRADAVNAGLRYAAHELVCMIDGDSLLAPTAMLEVAQPFIDDPDVVAAGGVVRPSNGTTVHRSDVTAVAMPRRSIERIQVLEYLRAFLVGRAGWSAMNGLMIISGAFGMFRTQAVLDVGGLNLGSLAEDADLVVSLHQHHRRQGLPYKVAFVSEPVCWTEVPTSLAQLASQRRRWSQGLGELLIKYRTMIFNPRYRVLGLVTLPYFLFFEFLGPAFALLGIILVGAAASLGLTSTVTVMTVIAATYGLSVLTSLVSLVIEQTAFAKYRGWRNTSALIGAACIEPLWYYSLHAFWRLQGLARALRSAPAEWGEMQRTGFEPGLETSGAAAAPPTGSH